MLNCVLMWPWLIGGVVAALLVVRSAAAFGKAGPTVTASRFVYVGGDGVQHVRNDAVTQKKFDEEMSQYHAFGVGAEQLTDGSIALRGKRDVGATEQMMPRLYNAVVQAAGPETMTGTFMPIADVDALLSGKRPQSITVFISPRGMTTAKARAGSQFVALD